MDDQRAADMCARRTPNPYGSQYMGYIRQTYRTVTNCLRLV